MKEDYIEGSGGKVYYWTNEVESSIAIVMCHGLTADHHLFDKQVEGLGDKYKLIVWDWPLHGKSRPYIGFTYDKVSSDLNCILNKENVLKIVLVGQSAGGYIAQSFTENYPDKVAGFIGIGTTPFGQRYYKSSEMFWLKHFTAIAKLYPYKSYCKASVKAVAITEEARKSMKDTLVELGKDGMLKSAKAVYDEFLAKSEEVDFKCPVLLTIGETDKTGYVQKYNKAWKTYKGYPLVSIEKAAHNANYDNYIRFNELLVEFMEEL